jgi:DNA-binding IclR family transcriptional regulator
MAMAQTVTDMIVLDMLTRGASTAQWIALQSGLQLAAVKTALDTLAAHKRVVRLPSGAFVLPARPMVVVRAAC